MQCKSAADVIEAQVFPIAAAVTRSSQRANNYYTYPVPPKTALRRTCFGSYSFNKSQHKSLIRKYFLDFLSL